MQAALELHPELAGCKFEEVHFRFTHAIALGVLRGEHMYLCPADDYIVRDSDEILLLRRSGSMQRDALSKPLVAQPDDWEPKMTAYEFSMVGLTPASGSDCFGCFVVQISSLSWTYSFGLTQQKVRTSGFVQVLWAS